MQITNATANDSSLQSSISAKVVGTPSPLTSVQQLIFLTNRKSDVFEKKL
jgi:hypothetical protein